MIELNEIKEKAKMTWLAQGNNISIHKEPSHEQKEKKAIHRRISQKKARGKRPMLICTQKTRCAFTRVIRGKSTLFGVELNKALPYSVEHFKRHIESKFKKEMTWDNYGKIWEIDHIKPVNCFNYKTIYDTDFLQCWGLENLQPLSPAENRKKSASEK